MIKPTNWSVIVAGSWNPAIFTPERIARGIFKVQDASVLNVHVPLNAIAPFRVEYHGVFVSADTSRLALEPTDPPSFDGLAKCLELGRDIIDELQKTPVTAAGINVRFTADEVTSKFRDLLGPNFDEALADAGFIVLTREIRRSVTFQQGVVNLRLVVDEAAQYGIEMNFHRESTRPEDLSAWLSTPAEDINRCVNRILEEVLGLQQEEAQDEQHVEQ